MSSGSPTRKVLLVGSMPFENESACMDAALDVIGADSLIALPDGEVGDKDETYPLGNRRSWVQFAIESNVRNTGAFTVLREPRKRRPDGSLHGFLDKWDLKPNHAAEDLAQHLDLGYVEWARKSYALFRERCPKASEQSIPFQVGVPTGGAIAFFSMSPFRAFQYRRAMDERIAMEVAEVVQELGSENVIIQVEAPLEVMLTGVLPSCCDSFPVRWLQETIERFPDHTRVGVHLCLGDLNHEKAATLHVHRMLVRFTNRLLANWPEDKKLEYVHFPLAEADVPPRTDPQTYAPLANVQLPDGVRFVAGFVHEKLSMEEHVSILKCIEDARKGSLVDVACSCGLGRRTPGSARQLMVVMKTLTKTTTK